MNIRILGAHNCESQDSRFLSLLIDDVLAVDAGGLTSSLSLSAQQQLEAVLLTHHHYDHIRDIPALAMSLYLHGAAVDIYSTPPVADLLKGYLLDGRLYPRFLELPEAKPTLRLVVIEPLKSGAIAGYAVRAVPVGHSEGAVGYQITSPEDKAIFYTGDTGPGLTGIWEHVSPQLLIIEVTVPNRYQEYAASSGHLTPSLLCRELAGFRETRGYLPRIVAVHLHPGLEGEIGEEIAAVSMDLQTTITIAREGMELWL